MSEILAIPSMEGTLSGMSEVQGEINQNFNYKSYTGDYVITPKFDQSIELETENCVMDDNLIVKEIPYYETPTLKGGTTIYVGTEV